jgi:protein-S-isoprenylcysteine O-methyltransferase Ste14
MNINARPRNEAGDVANGGLIRPPLVYLMSLIVGGLVQLAAPVPFVPRALTVPLGVSLVVVAIALFWFSVAKFQAAGAPVPGDKPSTAIVRTGPYRFSRNPI